MVREREIKSALIDWLYGKGLDSDSVIISELVVANWSRRADLAIANGKLYAYEIKSSADTLKRLPGQVDLFSSCFDKVTVVAATKFVPRILEDYPAEVGVLEVIEKKGVVTFKQARAGRLSNNRNSSTLAGFLTKLDICRLLRSEGIQASPDMSRDSLCLEMSGLPVRVVREYVLSVLKDKYRQEFEAFASARRILGSYESMSLLSRSESVVRANLDCDKKYPSLSRRVNPNARPLRLGALGLSSGQLQDLPVTVICRSRKT